MKDMMKQTCRKENRRACCCSFASCQRTRSLSDRVVVHAVDGDHAVASSACVPAILPRVETSVARAISALLRTVARCLVQAAAVLAHRRAVAATDGVDGPEKAGGGVDLVEHEAVAVGSSGLARRVIREVVVEARSGRLGAARTADRRHNRAVAVAHPVRGGVEAAGVVAGPDKREARRERARRESEKKDTFIVSTHEDVVSKKK